MSDHHIMENHESGSLPRDRQGSSMERGVTNHCDDDVEVIERFRINPRYRPHRQATQEWVVGRLSKHRDIRSSRYMREDLHTDPRNCTTPSDRRDERNSHESNRSTTLSHEIPRCLTRSNPASPIRCASSRSSYS